MCSFSDQTGFVVCFDREDEAAAVELVAEEGLDVAVEGGGDGVVAGIPARVRAALAEEEPEADIAAARGLAVVGREDPEALGAVLLADAERDGGLVLPVGGRLDELGDEGGLDVLADRAARKDVGVAPVEFLELLLAGAVAPLRLPDPGCLM